MELDLHQPQRQAEKAGACGERHQRSEEQAHQHFLAIGAGEEVPPDDENDGGEDADGIHPASFRQRRGLDVACDPIAQTAEPGEPPLQSGEMMVEPIGEKSGGTGRMAPQIL